jgi:glucokinase
LENKYLIGTDIGGTTFSSALFNDSYQLISVSPPNNISNYNSTEKLVNAICFQVNELIDDHPVKGVGFACPGPLNVDSGKILETPNLKLLQNYHFKQNVEAKLNIPCLIENDANLFALGEFNQSNKKVCIGITLGTGLGFGIIINGVLFTGGNGMAGEYGISPINKEIWESDISISGLQKITNKVFGLTINPIKLNLMANQKDEKALLVWREFGEKLGLCLSHVINFIDPNTISIGGGLSHAFPFFENSMRKTISNFSSSYNENKIIIFESKQKEISAKLGAVKLFKF